MNGGSGVMKLMTLKLLVAGVLILTAATALALDVKLVTFASAIDRTSSATSGARIVMGFPLAGRTSPAVEQSGVDFSYWRMLARTMVVSPVGDELPPVRNELFRNYPNPFNPSTQIRYTVAQEGAVRIDVYDLMGRKVDRLVDDVQPAGVFTINYQPKNLASGAYVILMRVGSFRATQSMMLVK